MAEIGIGFDSFDGFDGSDGFACAACFVDFVHCASSRQPSPARPERRQAGGRTAMPASINMESDPSDNASIGWSLSPVRSFGQPCQPLLHPRHSAAIKGVPWLWRHGPLVPEVRHPVAKLNPCPTNALASTTSIDLEGQKRRRATTSTTNRSRSRSLRESTAAEAPSGGDGSAGPPLRQRHNSDCGPGAPHREPTPCSPTAMAMDHAASAASDPCIGSVSAPSCHLFYGPSQASPQGTRDGAGAEIRSRPAAMAWRFDRGGLSGRRKIIRASDNSG